MSAIPRDDRLHLLTWGVVRVTAFVDVARRARSQATIYAARARHSVNATLLVNLPGDEMPLLIELLVHLGVN